MRALVLCLAVAACDGSPSPPSAGDMATAVEVDAATVRDLATGADVASELPDLAIAPSPDLVQPNLVGSPCDGGVPDPHLACQSSTVCVTVGNACAKTADCCKANTDIRYPGIANCNGNACCGAYWLMPCGRDSECCVDNGFGEVSVCRMGKCCMPGGGHAPNADFCCSRLANGPGLCF